MVDPDQVSVVQRDGITSPNILGVDVAEGHVLHNDIARLHDADALAFQGRAGARFSDKRLVAPHRDAQDAGVVVRDGAGRRVGLVVCAPVVLVDGDLAAARGAPGRAARGGRRALGAGEVVHAVEDDDARLGVAQVRDQLVGRRGVDGAGRATAGDALGKTSSSAYWGKELLVWDGWFQVLTSTKGKRTNDPVSGADHAGHQGHQSSVSLHGVFFPARI